MFYTPKVRTLVATFILLVTFVVPRALFAQTTGTNGNVQGGLNEIKNQFNSQSEIAQSQTVGDLILSVIRILIGLLMAITVLFIILGGYQYVTSAGNEEQAKRGRRTLTYAIIGLVVVILSYVIVNTVSGAVDSTQL